MDFRHFSQNVRPLIEGNTQAQTLEAAYHAGVESYGNLYTHVWSLVQRFAGKVPTSFWYDDAANAERYTSLHRVVLPAWIDMTMSVADEMAAAVMKRPGRIFVLDIGTGDGNLICTLASMLSAQARERTVLMASDRSSNMLRMHAERFSAAGVIVTPDGDLRGHGWREHELYRSYAPDFDGFTAIGAMGALQMVPDRSRVFTGARGLMKNGGSLTFCHDFLSEGESQDVYKSSEQTIRTGWGTSRATGSRVTLVGFIAGFIFRRFILSGDRLLTRTEESRCLMIAGFREPSVRSFWTPEFSILSSRVP